MDKWITDNLILKAYRGSIAYGLNTPESDADLVGITIPPKEFYLGLQSFEQYEGKDPEDTVIYGIQKFIRLVSECNPNIIEVLFTDPQHILSITPLGQKLIDNRNMFLSKRALPRFCGYAYAQMKRMKSHYDWINEAPEEPKREDFVFIEDFGIGPEWKEIDKQHRIRSNVASWEYHNAISGQLERFDRASYEARLQEWKEYCTWRANRNEKRAELEVSYGYDTKFAMHCMRLMLQGIDILRFGTFKTYMDSGKREFLKRVREGKFTYDEIIKLYDDYEKEMKSADAESPLPDKPDYKKINSLLIQITEEAHNVQNR
jgi:uncharacterized protein